jgi:hypothetical protein
MMETTPLKQLFRRFIVLVNFGNQGYAIFKTFAQPTERSRRYTVTV